MADVRALLRQQRTARRINHPHAVYSDLGKLSCAVCRELVRPESAWDDHLRGALHRQKVRALHTQTTRTDTTASPDGNHTASIPSAQAAPLQSQSQAQAQAQKRRYSETEDDGDVEMGSDGGGEGEDGPSRKRQHRPSVADTAKPTIEIKSPVATADKQQPGISRKGSGSEPRKLSLSTPQQLTPPLGRRSSGTPAQGVEMSIPSRPATPIAHKDSFLGGGSSSNGGSNSGTGGLTSAASTPKIAPLGRSPLIPQEASAAVPPPAILPDAAASASGSLLSAVINGAGSNASATMPTTATAMTTTAEADSSALGISQAEIDEDEWAAFEAEVVNAPAVAAAEAPRGGGRPDMNGGLVAAAGAVSSESLDAAGTGNVEDDERAKRRAAEEAQLEDEKAEATRALEEEFEDMQELESRVQKLKEKREALRNHTTAQPGNALSLAPPALIADAAARRPSATMIDKENIRQQLAASHNAAAAGKGQQAAALSDDDEDEDDEDADWDAFRFK
ncbi:hypothetical protein SCUCBS95973_007085 [Sporothrix curviconia]|uniref:Coiled-coil domain-containing protein 16 n=1 Tax=Sporothrix curviconia TaxID=1260050 RepID=A0ABP0CCS5_9PEZI